MIEERFEQLEEKLAYIEMANAELGEEIFRQQKEIDALTKAHRTMLERIEILQDTAAEGDVEGGVGQSEKPPHY
ncbi:SlyX family protein [SAR92 clade bacterium H921]|jgi:SlyX protein|nr:SlyX family protein [SAR92 clade bacterium H921]MDG0971926.1 SlyX family protein [Porticoccaceae bacterium]MDG1308790.1 SlyX family protein [Porticoccaceae bacterium]